MDVTVNMNIQTTATLTHRAATHTNRAYNNAHRNVFSLLCGDNDDGSITGQCDFLGSYYAAFLPPDHNGTYTGCNTTGYYTGL